MAAINWTDEALRWVDEIHDYIAKDNAPAAYRTIRGIFDRVQIVVDFPEIGYVYENPDDRNIRVLLYGHYRIVYLIKSESVIDILGVFHGSLDIDRFLNED